jgi:aerobic carbon-monoxide dehydrogenase large subunit
VAVDRRTGRIEVHRAQLVVDGGEVWNPVGYRGQLEGGFVYGLSQTLYEALVVEDGQVVTASLGDYKLACVADVPPLEIRLLPPLEVDRDPDVVRGGVGELANIGVPGAIANAIHDAVGVRIRHLPITAEAVWSALRSQDRPAPPGH